VPQKSVNINHSIVLKEMFKFKAGSKFVEKAQHRVRCTFNTHDFSFISVPAFPHTEYTSALPFFIKLL
jgi:hypothetical protein